MFDRPTASDSWTRWTSADVLPDGPLQEQGKLTGPMASLAKMHPAQKARGICREARDILGGNGLLLEYHVARHMTDMEVVHTYESTDSIQSLIVGRDVTGLSAFA